MKKTLIYLTIAILLANIALAQVEVRYIGVCNGNGICENKENYQNCPQDCLAGQKDNYCDGISDNVCDLDCPSQADPDCKPKISLCQNIIYNIKEPFIALKGLRPPMQKAYYIIITGSVIVILSIITLLVLLTRKIHKYRREKLTEEIKKEFKIPTTPPPKIKKLLKKKKVKKVKLVKPAKKLKPKPIKKPKKLKKKIKKKIKKPVKQKKPIKKAKPAKPKEIKLSPKMKKYYNMLEKPVKRLLAAGYTKEEIKAKLMEKRWPKEVLDNLFKKL